MITDPGLFIFPPQLAGSNIVLGFIDPVLKVDV